MQELLLFWAIRRIFVDLLEKFLFAIRNITLFIFYFAYRTVYLVQEMIDIDEIKI